MDCVDPTVLDQEDWVDFPFKEIVGEEAKLISKVNSTLTQNDFSAQSMKSWRTKFTRIFDSSFVTGHLARLVIVWNTCSDSTKNRILSMGIGERASADDFTFAYLLRIICLFGSPSHSEIALQSIYSGVPQSQNESIPVYLEQIRCLGEDGFGPDVKDCTLPKEKLVCTKCNLRGHTTKAHYGPVTKRVSTNILEPGEGSSSVFTCRPGDAATSFLDGRVNIGQTGSTSFVYCPRILIDTGALVPSGIAISYVFFLQIILGVT